MTDLTLVKKAEEVAEIAHAGQYRYHEQYQVHLNGQLQEKKKPYIVHPKRVADVFDDPVLQAIAWLHDVVEDTNITIKELQQHDLPAEVIHGVKGITKIQDESYLDYILRVKNNPFALPVKIADIKDNLASLPARNKTMRDKYELALYILTGDK